MSETATERAVAELLTTLELRYRRWDTALPGRPDFVLEDFRIAVFAHGCYWHRHSLCAAGRRLPQTRREYWASHFAQRVAYDQQQTHELRRDGWWVYVAWECELQNAADRIQRDISNWVDARLSGMKNQYPPI